MPRMPRQTPGGCVYHVMNRAVNRLTLFESDADYEAFIKVLAEALSQHPGIRLLTYCIMPNHWHLVVWPKGDKDLAAFMQRLTIMHARRWQEHRACHGTGHVYQGRYKSFVVECDRHLLTVIRYVERNALQARLVERAEDWRWCGLWVRNFGSNDQRGMLSNWPVPEPPRWIRTVNAALAAKEVEAVRLSIRRGRPFGSPSWVMKVADDLGLLQTFRERGRPKKATSRL